MKITIGRLKRVIKEAIKQEDPWDQTFPDSSDGAKVALKVMSSFDPRKISRASIEPDPSVAGVWVIYDVGDSGEDAIVYLKGYKDPYGTIRGENDFEVGNAKKPNSYY